MTIAVSVVVLAFGTEPFLAEAVDSVLSSTSDDTELIVVDNGAAAAVTALPESSRLRVVRPARNLGFAGGCNAGAAAARGDVLVFLNSDARVGRGSVQALAKAAAEPDTGVAGGLVLLADRPSLVNSAGNPVHVLGHSWAGGLGAAADGYREPAPVAVASGAFFAVRRSLWTELGGFFDPFFAYHEDAELSLRCWQRGLTVTLVPDARAWHHYAFGRNPEKLYLAERNRLLMVLTLFPYRLLLALLPLLVATELAGAVIALRGGWLAAKVRAWGWLLHNRRLVRRRRHAVQAERVASDRAFAALLTPAAPPGPLAHGRLLGLANWTIDRYWRCVLRVLDSAEPSR